MYWQDLYNNYVPASAKTSDIIALGQTVMPVNGLSIAGEFTHSTEFQAKYGQLDSAGFVTQLYKNVLDRAPDAAGQNNWINAINYGNANGAAFTKEMVLVDFAEGRENINNFLADWLIII